MFSLGLSNKELRLYEYHKISHKIVSVVHDTYFLKTKAEIPLITIFNFSSKLSSYLRH